MVYIVNNDANRIYVIDGRAKTVKTIVNNYTSDPSYNPFHYEFSTHVSVNPNTNMVYVVRDLGKGDKAKIENKITELYTNGKISDAHHQMLKDKISEYYNEVNKSQGLPIK
jgi:DNA-binding beta-propeller fold protein YncE